MDFQKDLLAQTGISYGQLYRWKRERLIPESWFDKRPAYTGQETYFPRELILERVYFILTHKDEYPLTQLRKLLSPGAASRAYALCDIARMENARSAAQAFQNLKGDVKLNHGQALTVLIAAQYDAVCHPKAEMLEEFIRCVLTWHEREGILDQNEGLLCAVETTDRHLYLFLPAGPRLLLPDDAKIAYSVHMNDVSRLFTRKLNGIYKTES